MIWHVPPARQGQIVEVAYTQVDGGGILIRRATDRSDGSVSYEEIWLDDDEQDLQPWHEEPIVRGEWRAIDEARVRYLEAAS